VSDLVELLEQLVRIDSTNPRLVPGAPGEAAVARFLAQRLEAAGLEVDLEEVEPGRPNVFARLPGSGGGRSLVFVSHMDVVGAQKAAFEPVRFGDKLFGRGACDMKAGMAAAVIAIERLAAFPAFLAGDILFAGCIDEEWVSSGVAHLAAHHRPDAAVLPERTNLDVVTTHGGFAWMTIESHGVEAPGDDPDHGVDAIRLLGPVLTGLSRLDTELAGRPPAAFGRGSVHASTIGGGSQLPAYPSHCTLGLERCLIPGETVAQAEAEVQALLDEAGAANPLFTAELSTLVGREPVTLDPSDPVVGALVAAATARLGHDATVRGDMGWMDSGLLVEAGIPCAIFGPKGAGEHTAEEWVDLDSVAVVADVLEAVARSYCA
jgi:acetylornithine deacetylase